MPVLTLGNTVYTNPVAKVMISIPDSLLERVDARANAAGETRSGFLQRLAERELEAVDARKREEIERLLDEIRLLGPGDNAMVDVAQLIREDRESH
jgi:HicB_like antitoxin of bacterial toxin-antitoxin system